MKTLYVIPNFLKADEEMGERLRGLGFVIKDASEWSLAKHSNEDVLLVGNHPDDTLLMRLIYFLKYLGKERKRFPVERKKFHSMLSVFKKKILFQGEPPGVEPYPYRNIDEMIRLYTKVFYKVDMRRQRGDVGFFMLPFDYEKDGDAVRMNEEYSRIPKTKYLTMINSNCRPKNLFNELYTERLRAIKHFSKREDFDLYGRGWDKLPRYNWHYYPYVKRSWRGEVRDKLAVLAQYKFTICFENSIYPGYVDVKFGDCYLAGSIPIYLGAPDVGIYIPTDSFIDMRGFRDYRELEIYLDTLTDKDIENYRQAMRNFLLSPGFKVFSKGRFNETILSAIAQHFIPNTT